MRDRQNFFSRYVSKLPLAFLLLVAGVAALVAFGVLAHEVLGENENGFDNVVFNYLRENLITPRLTPLMEGFTFLGSSTFLLPAYLLFIIFYLYKKQKRRSIEIFLIGALGILLNYLMKLFYHRVRPTEPLISPLQSFSFPSGHAMSAFIFYGLLIYLVWNTQLTRIYKVIAAIFLVAIALAVGFSRVYLRVHYPSDVIAGFCLGLAWICFAIWVLEKIKNKAKKETETKSKSE
jgi:undecaprenyl-diphosphatase